MECAEFRRRLKASAALRTPASLKSRRIQLSSDEEWFSHGLACVGCADYEMACIVRADGVNLSRFPCVHAAHYSLHRCSMHRDGWSCPDTMLVKTRRGFGLPVRNGGSSYIEIQFCPWCGIALSKTPVSGKGAGRKAVSQRGAELRRTSRKTARRTRR